MERSDERLTLHLCIGFFSSLFVWIVRASESAVNQRVGFMGGSALRLTPRGPSPFSGVKLASSPPWQGPGQLSGGKMALRVGIPAASKLICCCQPASPTERALRSKHSSFSFSTTPTLPFRPKLIFIVMHELGRNSLCPFRFPIFRGAICRAKTSLGNELDGGGGTSSSSSSSSSNVRQTSNEYFLSLS